jgi:hypothetical protein
MAFRPGFGRTGHEIVVKLCRALSCRYPVNCVVVRPERYGIVANRLRHSASQRHGRRTEAGGKASHADAEAGGNPSFISPDFAEPDDTMGWERFSTAEACRARENLQQLHGWLRNKFQVWQPTLEWMLRVGGSSSSFFANVQKRTQL